MSPDRASGWRVVEATFERSAASLEGCPRDGVPEVAIVGRSNVGKSSLFNALCGQQGLARVSRTPGRTQLINLFRLVLQGPERAREHLRCADLPGYGYAAAARQTRERFAPMIGGYLGGREGLRALVVLVDLRRGLTDLDQQMLEFSAAAAVPAVLVGTKADKLGAAEIGLARQKLAQSLGVRKSDVHVTSASSGRGIGDLIDHLAELAGQDPVAAAPSEDSAR